MKFFLRNQWGTVYAHNYVKNILIGHAYPRALRAHMLSTASIIAELLDTPNCLSGINLNKVQSLHEMLLKHACRPGLTAEHAASRVSQIIEDLQEDEILSNITGNLWIQYLKMVSSIDFHAG